MFSLSSLFKPSTEAQQLAAAIEEAKACRSVFACQQEHAAAMVLMLDRRLARLRNEQRACEGANV